MAPSNSAIRPTATIGMAEQMVINPEQSETVRWIFKQVLSGKGTHAISDELNANSIPTKKGGRWTPTTVRGMVSNEK